MLRVLVVALLAGASVAFAFAEAVKLDVPLTSGGTRRVFSPTCDCAKSEARFVFRLTESDTIDATVVDEEGEPVRVLASGEARPAGRVALRWNGRDDRGALAADGRYRLRVRLAEADRTVVLPSRVRLDTEPPEVALVSAAPRVLSPERGDELEVVYRTSERSRAALAVAGAVAARSGYSPAGTHALSWDGSVEGRPLERGAHPVVLRVRDRAGNATATDPLRVRLR